MYSKKVMELFKSPHNSPFSPVGKKALAEYLCAAARRTCAFGAEV